MIPRTTKDSGIPTRPVTAKLLGTPPATTVNGAEAAMIMKTSAGIPMRRASSEAVAAGAFPTSVECRSAPLLIGEPRPPLAGSELRVLM